jgi:hypothetical protein
MQGTLVGFETGEYAPRGCQDIRRRLDAGEFERLRLQRVRAWFEEDCDPFSRNLE